MRIARLAAEGRESGTHGAGKARGFAMARAVVTMVALGAACWSCAAGAVDAQDARASASAVLVSGRCVDAEQGVALAGCRISVLAVEPSAPPRLLSMRKGAERVSTTTDAEGSFELRWVPEDGTEEMLVVRAEGRGTRRCLLDAWTGGEVLEVGELRMQRAARCAGRVVDRMGRPVPELRFQLTAQAATHLDVVAGTKSLRVVTDAEGRFRIEEPLHPGAWRAWWPALWRNRDQTIIWLDAGQETQLELTAPIDDERQSIRGTLVDARGHPIAMSSLEAEGGGTVGVSQTESDGRFRIPRVGPYDPDARGPVVLRLPAFIDYWRMEAPVVTAWGAQDLEVVAHAPASALVEAIDASTGARIGPCSARVAQLTPDGSDWTPRQYSVDMLQTGARVRSMLPTRHVLRCEPSDMRYASSRLLEFEPADEQTLVRVPLERLRRITVQVVDWTGASIEGAEISSFQALRPITGTVSAASLVGVRSRPPETRWFRGGTWFQPLGMARTGPHGTAELPVDGGPCYVVAQSLRHLDLVHGPVTFDASASELQLVVEPGCRLDARIGSVELLTASPLIPAVLACRELLDESASIELSRILPTVIARRAQFEQDPQDWQPDLEAPVGGDGVVSLSCLPPGTYDVLLRLGLENPGVHAAELERPLGRFELTLDRPSSITTDLAGTAPGTARVRLVVNGKSWAGEVVTMNGKPHSGTNCRAEAVTDANGTFELRMFPGDYLVHLSHRNAPESAQGNIGFWYAQERIAVRSGAHTEQTIHVRRVHARLRVRTEEGKAASGLTFTVNTKGEPQGWASWQTDVDGCLVLDPAPLGAFQLLLTDWSRANVTPPEGMSPRTAVWLGPFRVPEEGTDATFDVTLPEGWR